MLDLHVLDIFVRTAEAGSFTKAAIYLEMSQSILSRQLKSLEAELGYRLFHRTGRGVTLTEPGRRLLPRAKGLLRSAREFTDEAKTAGGAPSGMVSIGLPGSVAGMLAGPLSQVAREKYPKVTMRFVEALSGAIDEMLLLGRIDLGLSYTGKANVRRGEIPLCVVEMVLVGPPGDTLTSKKTVDLKKLEGRELVLPSFPHALRRLIEESCMQQGFPALVPFEVDSLSTMKEVVAAGGGYTVAPYDSVSHDVAAGRVQVARITNPTIRRLLVMASAGATTTSTAARAIGDLIPTLIARWIRQGRLTATLP